MDGKLATGALVALILSFGAAGAQATDGRIVFGGAVLAPTCASGLGTPRTAPAAVTVPSAASHASGNACGVPAARRAAATVYTRSTTALPTSRALLQLARLSGGQVVPQPEVAAVRTRTYR